MNGKAHLGMNLAVLYANVTITYVCLPSDFLLPVLTGSIAGILITPDYDYEKNLPKSIVSEIPLLGKIWDIIWYPYARFVKHRSFWSHSFLFSTALRMFYLFSFVILCLLVLAQVGVDIPLYEFTQLIFSDGVLQFLLITFVAWSLQDLSHLILDTKFFRRFKKK